MTPALPILRVARFVLEARSAFAIASGLSDGAFDALVVRDANNLPAIPGSTLAGVLRHLYQQQQDEKAADCLFGFINPYAKQEGQPSRIQVSWGCVHDSDDHPVEGICDGIRDDALLKRLAQDHPMHRERVRLNERGVADNQAKFDMTIMPAGCRFSFEVMLWSAGDDTPQEAGKAGLAPDQEWESLLGLLSGHGIRLGGAVRSGFGLFELQRLYEATFDLRNPEHYLAFSVLPVSLGSYGDLQPCALAESDPVTVTLSLKPEDFWRIGQGFESISEPQSGDREPDALPFTEPRINWSEGKGQWSPRMVLIPGSSIKGAIRHRTDFHYRRLCQWGKYQESGNGEKGIEQLFGQLANTEAGHSSGQAGSLFFSDLYLDEMPVVTKVPHTSIDRFTGGVRDGVLFLEEVLWRNDKPLCLQISVDQQRLEKVDEVAKTALRFALDDLQNGRLALGAGSSKGHGFFRGKTLLSEQAEPLSWIGGQVSE